VRKEIAKPEEQAGALAKMVKETVRTREQAESGLAADGKATAAHSGASGALQPIRVKPTVASRTAMTVNRLRECLKRWFQYYGGYDPLFTWWVSQPYKEADKALEPTAIL
jgi:hypothetical protein